MTRKKSTFSIVCFRIFLIYRWWNPPIRTHGHKGTCKICPRFTDEGYGVSLQSYSQAAEDLHLAPGSLASGLLCCMPWVSATKICSGRWGLNIIFGFPHHTTLLPYRETAPVLDIKGTLGISVVGFRGQRTRKSLSLEPLAGNSSPETLKN
jgi:hypothetical protein